MATATFNGNGAHGCWRNSGRMTPWMYPYNGTWSGSFYGATAD